MQQATEKGLKAWLHQLNLLPPRSHDLARLLLMLKDAGAPIDDFENLERLEIAEIHSIDSDFDVSRLFRRQPFTVRPCHEP